MRDTNITKSYTVWRVNGDAATRDCHADNVTSFQRLERQKKSKYTENIINAQISKAESLYKGKGPLSEPDSYRGVALQCVVLKR